MAVVKVVGAMVVFVVVAGIGIACYWYSLMDAISMYPRSRKPVDNDKLSPE
jgi:hypothetical protein